MNATHDSQHVLAPYREGRRWILINSLASFIGVLGGLSAVLLHYLIEWLSYLFGFILQFFAGVQVLNFNLGHILIAVIGSLIVGFLTHKISKESKGSGIPKVIESAALNRGKMPLKLGPIKLISSALTISTVSAGKEGPISQIGAWFGSIIGNKLKLRPYEIRLLIASGVAAGVAGTFNTPLGGAFFSLEVLFNGFGIFSSIPVFIASAIGAVTSSMFLGTETAFTHEFHQAIFNPNEYFLIAIFGIAFGLIGYGWIKFLTFFKNFFERLNTYPYLKPVIGSFLTGIIIMIFPNFGLIGTGYSGINSALDLELFPVLMILLGFLKMTATALTIESDNSGGLFGPSLYIGCMFGGVIGYIFQLFIPSWVNDYTIYMILGMAAMFASSAQSPINMSIMIAEMTKNFWLAPAVMLACGFSFATSWLLFDRSSIYSIKVGKEGKKLKVGTLFLLQNLSIDEILGESYLKMSSNIPINMAHDILSNYQKNKVPVVDQGKLVGMISLKYLEKFPKEDWENHTVKEIMSTDIPRIDHFAKLQDALDLMVEKGTKSLVVTFRNDPNLAMGVIRRTDIEDVFANIK